MYLGSIIILSFNKALCAETDQDIDFEIEHANTIPKNDSMLVIVSLDQGKQVISEFNFLNLTIKSEEGESIVLEIDNRDEESWDFSVINYWSINKLTNLALMNFNVRDYVKSEVSITGFPRNSEFVSFFQLSNSGIRDWVNIHQAVIDGTVSDNIFPMGIWICVPLNHSGRSISTPRIIFINEPKSKFDFHELPEINDALKDALSNVKLIKSKMIFPSNTNSDPFSKEDFNKNDPFENDPE